MTVIATAGHVDHGKSTLVRALTGIEPDRWAEERRRGLTIDLGFAWTELADGSPLALVDVPGHSRFLANTLAGLGPVSMVMLVVAADEGWRTQTIEHLAAIDGFGISHGVVVLTRTDLADDAAVTSARAETARRIAPTSLAGAEIVPVSANTGAGLEELRAALARMIAAAPTPQVQARVRLWVDRSFSVKGAGTVVTGTLTAGTLRVGQRLEVCAADGSTSEVTVRGLQSREQDQSQVTAAARVAVNLRGVTADQVRRGDALLDPGAWLLTEEVDVRAVDPTALSALGEQVSLHVGTATQSVRWRSLGPGHGRLRLERALPVQPGDRIVLREPSRHDRMTGVQVLDVDPVPLRRRGSAARHAQVLAARAVAPDLAAEVARRGAVRASYLGLLGVRDTAPGSGQVAVAGWLVDRQALAGWATRLCDYVEQTLQLQPMSPGPTEGACVDRLALPSAELLAEVVGVAGLRLDGGHVVDPARAEAVAGIISAVDEIRGWLATEPFNAPDAQELSDLGLGAAELAVAERHGLLLRMRAEPVDIVLLPDAVERAIEILRGLPQPFTASQAKQALDSTRRVVIPLLERLDALGRTERVDANQRRLRA